MTKKALLEQQEITLSSTIKTINNLFTAVKEKDNPLFSTLCNDKNTLDNVSFKE